VDLKDLRDNPAVWRILEERARTLAIQEITAGAELGEEILSFRLGDGGYSILARFIREVQPLDRITPLPSTPPFVLGLVNVRGRLLAALDIRPLLDIPQTPPAADAFLLVLTANGIEVGLLADAVIEVRRGDDDLAPVLSTTAGRGTTWIMGVDRQLNLLIDPPALLSDPRLIVNQASE
jgi:purine-binding chemotaxis protein CheW